ncbi:FusB/FusC family EF-G-binding protein [Macrococcus armenti]|uniref:FusB/FusC family EF-G-binding protein n=1 Tax=Macrococcus armenti TaxID=2875764 RepID=UPI001CCDFE5E|nr:FusB/FusC family EF-G-binding protein [Macrococcus armenti]UBH22416.1 FusB/FusC family EF-G-binding protein [Macrococcus armenti]
MNQIKVYEFVKVKTLIYQLIRLYRTNDIKAHSTQKTVLLNEIEDIFQSYGIDVTEFIKAIDDVQLTKKKADHLLEGMKVHVQDFDMPTQAQLNKLFRKVKKLKAPDVNTMDTKETSYLGWNDVSANRKYIVYKNEADQFEGIYGEISPNKVKGFCNICNAESDVALFLNKTKQNKSEGTYTKKGDYICHDSVKCNQNLENIEALYEFVERTK